MSLLALAGLGSSALVVRGIDRSLPELDPPAQELYLAVAPDQGTSSSSAQLVLGLTKPGQLRGSGASGTVTEVELRKGQLVKPGTSLYEVNAATVRAMADRTVLYRAVALGMTGEDVVAVQEFLALSTDKSLPATGKVGPQTIRAVKAYALANGWGSASAFSPSWIVPVPSAGTTVGSVTLGRGVAAPSSEVFIASGVGEVGSASISTSASGADGVWHFAVEGEMLDVRKTGDKFTVVSVSDAAGLQALGTRSATAITVKGRISPARPTTALAVPASAIVVDGSLRCVWTRGAAKASVVVVSGQGLGSGALVTTGVTEGQEVLVNPREVGKASSCS